jgi:hypothetical protein
LVGKDLTWDLARIENTNKRLDTTGVDIGVILGKENNVKFFFFLWIYTL